MTNKEAHRVRDRRVLRTHGRLRAALHSLIHEKTYDSIVVKEILHRADVGRSTFYAHFDDKDQLLASLIIEMVGTSGSRQDVLRFSLPILRHVERYKRGPESAAADSDALHARLESILLGLVRPELEQMRTELPADFLARYTVSTFLVVLTWWAEAGSALPPEKVDALFRRLVLPALKASRA